MYTNLLKSGLAHSEQTIRLSATVAVTVSELLDYLRACGIPARYVDESFNGYVCNGKRVNLRGLLHLANAYRSSDGLPPLTIRHLV